MGFIKKTVLLSGLLLIAHCGAVPVTVNGEDINEIVQPGEVFSYESTKEQKAFFFKNGNLKIGSVFCQFESTLADWMKEKYEELSSGRMSRLSNGDTIQLQGERENEHVQTNKTIIFTPSDGSDTVKIENMILQAKVIIYLAKKIELVNCFVKGSSVVLFVSSSQNSLFKAIQFNFASDESGQEKDQNIEKVHLINGTIDMETGAMPEQLVATGADRIAFLLNDQAFE